jgi:fatty-acyl-CoA synthase
VSRILPVDVGTLGGMFHFAAVRYPGATAGDAFSEEAVGYGQVADDGRAVARNLVAAGVAPGAPVAVLVTSAVDLVRAAGGIAAAGAVMVPLPVPVMSGGAHLARLGHVIAASGVRYAVVTDGLAPTVASMLPGIETMRLSALLRPMTGERPLPAVGPDDLAIVQYTSGSTSAPQGVALTHRNVLAGIRALHQGTGVTEGDLVCHWLPLSHDMGLFSTLSAVGAGVDVRTSSPQAYIKRPTEWLRRFGELRATLSVGPNFGYRYLIDAVPHDTVGEYDLSAVRMLLNGAEPVDAGLAAAFAEHFAGAGLARHAMTPCYGLAEATLAVTIADPAAPVAVDWVVREALNDAGQAQPAPPAASSSRGVVSCGAPVRGMEVRVAESGRALGDRVVGDIEIRGEAVMRGYFREPEPHVTDDGWCPTGDLGYLVDGCLYVTGRSKEMLIVGGRNHYPQDVEEAVRQVAGIHAGRAVAVVLADDPERGRPERIAVLAEVGDPLQSLGDTVSRIRGAAAQDLDGTAVDVVLLRRGALLRTTSGKFQRLLMRRRLLGGTLDGVLMHVAVDEPVPVLQGA